MRAAPLATTGEAGDGQAARIAAYTEDRMGRGMSYVRLATAVLVVVPVLHYDRLTRPLLALGVAVAAIAESLWLFWWVRRQGTMRDRTLLWVDAVTCVAVVFAMSRTVHPSQRDSGLLEVVSFALAGAGFAGFGFGWSVAGVAVTAGLSAGWALSVIPAVDIKLASDIAGFALWYGVTVLTGREFRSMAAMADEARAQAAAEQAESAERRRAADVAREREITHREIHEHLLPIVDAVARGDMHTDGVARLAGREAERARRLIVDGRLPQRAGFAAMIADVVETYGDAGLQITSVYRIVADPPADVAEILTAATREAFCNVVKYAKAADETVNLYVESTEAGTEVTVRDHGVGFDPETTVAGGGFLVTYGAVRRCGGTVNVVSRPQGGTKVAFVWPGPVAEPVPEAAP